MMFGRATPLPHLGRPAVAPLTFIGLFFLLQCALAFRLNLNWDEYFYLNHVYAHQQGQLTVALQTFHIHIFAWLTSLPMEAADQLVIGRLFMLGCEAVTLICLYAIACKLSSPRQAIWAVVIWCAAGHALAHGMSFRADPLAAMLMMASLALLFSNQLSWRRSAIAGLLAACGLLVTIKCALYMPAFLAALLWQWHRHRSINIVLVQFAIAAASLAVGAAVLWAWHGATLSVALPDPTGQLSETTREAGKASAAAFRSTIIPQELFPRWPYIRHWLAISFVPMLLIACGAALMVKRSLSGTAGARAQGICLFLLAAPLLSLVFYRNAFAYFFPFIMFPATLIVLPAMVILKKGHRAALALTAMAIVLLAQLSIQWQRDQSTQRLVAATAHRLFPESVAYIDRSASLPGWPRTNHILSSWAVEGSNQDNRPIIAPVIRDMQPPLLLLNSPYLLAAVGNKPLTKGAQLLEQDATALRNNYIPHWGPVWVAGKRIGLGAAFEIIIGGEYTLECDGTRIINGLPRRCGTPMKFAPGQYEFSGGVAKLRWGDNLPRPSYSSPKRPFFYGF